MRQSKKLKLAVLTSTLDRNAQEEGFIIDWVEALTQEVDELIVFLLKPPKSKLRAKNIRLYVLSQKNKLAKLLSLFQNLYQEHQRQPFNGFFTQIFEFLAVPAALFGKLFKVKTIFWHAGGKELPPFSLLHLAMKLSDKIVTCSNLEKKRYQRAYQLNSQKVYCLGHAINIQHFKTKAKMKMKKKKKSFIIGTVGRATPKKNFETLIKALALLKTKQKLKLILVLSRIKENPAYFKKIKKLLKKNKKRFSYQVITHASYQTIPSIYQKFDLYIHPSLLKSIDKTCLEAAATGIPVLLSSSGYKEIAVACPQIIFNPQDAKTLAQKIKKSIAHYQALCKNQISFQKEIIKNYSLPTFTKRLVKIYLNSK